MISILSQYRTYQFHESLVWPIYHSWQISNFETSHRDFCGQFHKHWNNYLVKKYTTMSLVTILFIVMSIMQYFHFSIYPSWLSYSLNKSVLSWYKTHFQCVSLYMIHQFFEFYQNTQYLLLFIRLCHMDCLPIYQVRCIIRLSLNLDPIAFT